MHMHYIIHTDKFIFSIDFTFVLDCSPGYSKVGDNCLHICDTSDPCQNGGTCNIDGDSYICTCAASWTGQNCTGKQ